MKKQEKYKPESEYIAYEDARLDKGCKAEPEEVTDREVERATQIINPDGNSMESRG